jgi:hypothetical protein
MARLRAAPTVVAKERSVGHSGVEGQIVASGGAREPSEARIGLVVLLEFLVFAPLAAVIALWVVPEAFGVESQCVGALGVQRVAGDAYVATIAVAGTFGWLLVLLGEVFARIAGARRLALLLPVAWFVLLVAVALVMAAATGSEPCPS